MFRHHGKSRTLSHNLKTASLLSFVAGMVNVIGFLSVQKLTTNVTGHFAFFVDEFFRFQFSKSIIYILYILSFLFGSFVSNFLVEIAYRKTEKNIFVLPVLIEVIILLGVGLFGSLSTSNYPDVIALSLLFAMGLQNSLVTRLSNALVRTTHLTGLFTDLGIELSQLFFYKTREQRKQLLGNIRLRARIILFFFLGGTFAGLIYPYFQLHALTIASLTLFTGLVYDKVRYQIIVWKNARK